MTPPAQTSVAPAPAALLGVHGVIKSYGGVRALAGVDLGIHPGRVHAIVGENGAGKSTLMKILAGAVAPDMGAMSLDGEPYAPANVGQAAEKGIAIVFQELSLYPELDVLSNLFALREPRRFGLDNRREMRRLAEPVLAEIGLEVEYRESVKSLSLAKRQLLEIARGLLVDSRILILDEPNSALNATESAQLFQVVRKLRDRGVAVLYISHRLEEVFAIAEVITVMRNGAIVGDFDPSASSVPEVVTAMLGRESETLTPRRASAIHEGDPLQFDRVSVGKKLNGVTFSAAPGEVVGIAGLEGSGVETVFELAFGITEPDTGRVVLPDGVRGPRSVPDAVRKGIAMVPADRRRAGLMLADPVAVNLAHVSTGALGMQGFMVRRSTMAASARKVIDRLSIKTSSEWTPVGQLSGGNQQKVVLGKWLEANPHVVLLQDPTRGVDVGAKREIYDLIRTIASEGRILLFSSTELTEYFYVCDRVLVVYRGDVRMELRGSAINEHRLLEAVNTGI